MKNLPQIAIDFAAETKTLQNESVEYKAPAQPSPGDLHAGVGVRLKHNKQMDPDQKPAPPPVDPPPAQQATIEPMPTQPLPPDAISPDGMPPEGSPPETIPLDQSPVELNLAEWIPTTKSTRGRKSLKQVSAEADLIEIPADEELFSKQYYTMGEVAAMFRVNQSLLRFWESEFNILQPRKNKKGDRYFRPADIKNLHLIYHLLRQRKYTIEGAKEFLKNSKKADVKFEAIRRLQEIKAFLLELKSQL